VQLEVRLLRAGGEVAVAAARAPFDGPPDRSATRRLLAEPTHHLLIAYDTVGSGRTLARAAVAATAAARCAWVATGRCFT
jgi:hypothetical protein